MVKPFENTSLTAISKKSSKSLNCGTKSPLKVFFKNTVLLLSWRIWTRRSRTHRVKEPQKYWNSNELLLVTLNINDQCMFCCVRSFRRFDLFKVQILNHHGHWRSNEVNYGQTFPVTIIPFSGSLKSVIWVPGGGL